MNRKLPITFLLCTSLLLQMAACSPGAKHKESGRKGKLLNSGQVMPKVSCIQDSSISYAIYLPKNYDPSKRYPLILAFDSHAAGKIPVGLFSEEAERYGYIVAGSNNSRNGVAWEITLSQYSKMRQDILQRLSVDTSRVYTAGFSGGSRVAASVAIFKGGISGVIGCSAGFPQIDKPLSTRFSYLGIVGNADFNYTEMKTLDKALDGAGFVHHLLVFDGIHAWPPASLIPAIFTWLELDAVRQKLNPADENFITRVRLKYQKEVDSLQRESAIVAGYWKCLEALHYLSGVTDISSYSVLATQLGNTSEVKNHEEENDRLAKKETELQQYYAGAMGSQSEEWWMAEVNRLTGPPNGNFSKPERLMYKRVLGYLSLASYMHSINTLKSGDREKSGYFIRVYALVDPTNPEAPYLQAGWFAGQGKVVEALVSLNNAVNLGFNDLKRIEGDPAFRNLKGQLGYETLLGKIKGEKLNTDQ
jgi:hypothetical protein